ncbi:MAG: methionine adenosyltransferase domain-containing protein [bacterium]|nr:methionine adenosyltransferase domain-containing protein [bacterium]
MDFSVSGILAASNLQRAIPYRETARYGHFGNDQFSWEKVVGF